MITTQKFRESQLNLRFHQFLTNSLSSCVSKVFTKEMMTFKFFKLFLQKRVVKRTTKYNMKKSTNGAKAQKAHKRENLAFQRNLRPSKFLCFYQYLSNILTPSGSKNFLRIK